MILDNDPKGKNLGLNLNSGRILPKIYAFREKSAPDGAEKKKTLVQLAAEVIEAWSYNS